MKAKWLLVKDKFESLHTRERALILGALVAMVYLLWEFSFLKPMAEATKAALAQEAIVNGSIKVAEAEVTVMSSLSGHDPNALLKQEIQQLSEKLEGLDSQLASLAVGLIKADQLPVMLHQMLAQSHKMQLLSLTTLPVETIELAAQPSPGEELVHSSSANMAQLYKHAVQVKLQGGYAATYEFMQSLEQSDWKFYWDSFNYEVKEYPSAVITLRVFTLASDKGVFDGNVGAL